MLVRSLAVRVTSVGLVAENFPLPPMRQLLELADVRRIGRRGHQRVHQHQCSMNF